MEAFPFDGSPEVLEQPQVQGVQCFITAPSSAQPSLRDVTASDKDWQSAELQFLLALV